MKSWLEKNDIAVYSTHNEGKFIVDERFIRASKNEIYKYMTSISKNVFRGHMLLAILKAKKFLLQKRITKNKSKSGDKLYIKWKGYNNFFNSWIDKKTRYK